MFDVQSSPSNSKPENELFPELATKPAPASKRAPVSLPKPPARVSGLPLPPSMRKPKLAEPETIEAADVIEEDEAETVDLREMSDDSEIVADAELIEDDAPAAEASPLDALGSTLKSGRAILPKYDAELDDGPTVALPSSVANPPPTSRPGPRSQRVSPPVASARPSSSPKSAPLKSAPLPPLPKPPASKPAASAPKSMPAPSRKPSAPPTSARVPTGLLRTGSSVAPPRSRSCPCNGSRRCAGGNRRAEHRLESSLEHPPGC